MVALVDHRVKGAHQVIKALLPVLCEPVSRRFRALQQPCILLHHPVDALLLLKCEGRGAKADASYALLRLQCEGLQESRHGAEVDRGAEGMGVVAHELLFAFSRTAKHRVPVFIFTDLDQVL